MEKNNTSYHWSIEDLRRYHSGEMSETQKHTLEKAALDDPFLADALDGYANDPAPDKNIQEIRERISNTKPAKIVKFNTSKWAIAASLLILLGIGAWFYTSKNDQEESEVVQVSTADSIGPIASVEKPLTQKNEEIKDLPAEPPASNEVTNLQTSKREKLPVKQSPPAKNEYAASSDTSNNATPAVATASANKIQEPSTVVASKPDQVNVSLQPNSVKRNYSVEPSNMARQSSASSKPRISFEFLENTDAVGVQSAFIANANKYWKETVAGEKYITGKVILTFITGPTGVPEEIIVESGLSNEMDAIAIDILQHGGQWMPAPTSQRKKLAINFY